MKKFGFLATCFLLLGSLLSGCSERPSSISREAAALNSLRAIHQAQAQFVSAKDRFGTLRELAAEHLIDEAYVSGSVIGGYRYWDSDVSADTYCVHADRVNSRSGYKDFSVDESGIIRYLESPSVGTVPKGGGYAMSSGAH